MHRFVRASFAISLLIITLAAPLQVRGGTTPAPDATADPLSRPAILSAMRRACDYQLERQKTTRDNGWIRSAFYTGVMQTWRATGDEKYLQQALSWAKAFDFTPPAVRHADNHCCIQTYSELYLDHEPDPRFILPARLTFDRMMATPRRGRDEWWWCDALFMAPPALARLSAATGDGRYLQYMDEMWWDTHAFLFDREYGLFYRDASFFDAKAANGKQVFWSRGNGWVMAGTVRVLQYLPDDFPTRQKYIDLHRTMAASIAPLQGSDGLWRPSLLDPNQFATGETSGSAFFTYALAWGINHGTLDRATYLPIVNKAWRGLVGCLTPEGRLTHVQGVAAAPGAVKPDATHEYAVGAFLLAAGEMLQLAPATSPEQAKPTTLRLDFGAAATEKGFTPVDLNTRFSNPPGYGWTGELPDVVLRNRRGPDALRRDYVFGRAPATFRASLAGGQRYLVTLIAGDMEFGDHALSVRLNVPGAPKLPEIHPDAAEFATLSFTLDVPKDQEAVEFTFDSPVDNWVVNAIMIAPAPDDRAVAPVVSRQRFAMPEPKDSWAGDVAKTPDPIAPFVEQFRRNLADGSAPAIQPTGIRRDDYLKLIAGDVDFFKQHQDEHGAIIDPYKHEEFQYSTPCFAWAATALVEYAGRKDLVEPAAKAMDWACLTLSEGRAANHHEDFFPPQLAHALPLLKDKVAPERYATWVEQLKSYDPMKVYRSGPGGGNWNVVSLSGEYLYTKLGLRPDLSYVERSLAAQGTHFNYPFGLYTEGPMAYDHFPRLWAADMIAHGYDGKNADNLRETLRRAALTSLFMQSPAGELPAGGRSAHHQWNEAEQAVTYEIYAAKALADGDAQLAGVFKRAAHLAFASMSRWQRPSGELWIVKNRFDPEKRHGYEGYSSHSQYNLLPMAMLAIAYQQAQPTEDVREIATPAEVGGFVLDLRPVFHKVFANAGGMYIEIDVTGDMIHNPTGLIRIHPRGLNPQLGPSDGVTEKTVEEYPIKPTTTAAVGIAWQDPAGNWRRLAEYGADRLSRVDLLDVQATPKRVSFQLLYHGYFSGPSIVSERYVVTPERVEVTSELPGYDGPMQYVFPLLSEISETLKTDLKVEGRSASVSLAGQGETFTAPEAEKVRIDPQRQPHRNGWIHLGIADFPAGRGKATLIIEPKR